MRQRLRGIWFSLALLLVAAVLEVGGDAIVRFGLHASSFSAKASLLVLGAGILFAYGVFVNSAPADFGRLLGIYIVNRLAFGVTPSAPILVGGAFIVIGGAVMTLWRASQS
jgi:hypothetical protein